MSPRQALVDLIERIPDEDVPLVRSVVARFVPGLTIAEVRAIADAAPADTEPLSESEEQGFAEAEDYLAGRTTERPLPTPEERREALRSLVARAIPGLSIPPDALRREAIYQDHEVGED